MTRRTDGKLKLKSAMKRRKPLREISNTKSSKKSAALKLLTPVKPNIEKVQQNGDPLDRLLLIHSDVSSLLRQIDELVVKALEVNPTDCEKSGEIISFTNVLSEIHSSLKPWVLRFQKSLSFPSVDSDVQSGETSVGAPAVNEGEEHDVDTPLPAKYESLVSPSPLVSWRANDCTAEIGKQLFLLTPLPRSRTTSSKPPASSKPATFKGIATSTAVPYRGDICKSTHDKPKVNLKNVESASLLELLSPLKISAGDSSTILATPSLQNSPPISCVPQEPDPEFFYRKIDQFHKSTPFPTGNRSFSDMTDSESSSGEISEKLGLKYPELIGIKPSGTIKNESRVLEESPAWIRSPPKYCTLLEPVDENPARDNAPPGSVLEALASSFNQQMSLVPPRECSIRIDDQNEENKKVLCHAGKFAMIDSTPLWKGCESTVNRGKRPGENTLKKELWTKFEAASTDDFRPKFSSLHDASHKGFLDRLEEACCDET